VPSPCPFRNVNDIFKGLGLLGQAYTPGKLGGNGPVHSHSDNISNGQPFDLTSANGVVGQYLLNQVHRLGLLGPHVDGRQLSRCLFLRIQRLELRFCEEKNLPIVAGSSGPASAKSKAAEILRLLPFLRPDLCL
jgi:hypothetical protein